MLANDVIMDWTKHPQLKAALEEMASSPLSEFGNPTILNTFTAHLAAGAKTIRISIAMIDEGEMFPDDLSN